MCRLHVDTFHQHSDFLVCIHYVILRSMYSALFRRSTVSRLDYIDYANKSLLYDNNHTPMQAASDLHLHVDLPQVSNKYSTYLISPLLIVDSMLSAKYFIVMQPQFGIGT